MTEHTPTPWDYRLAKFPTDGEYDCGISAVIDGKPRCIAEAVGRCAATITLPAEANAAFIVKAVNNHEALVKALERMLVDPPATLDEPDTDAEVIIKMRAIAREALVAVGNAGDTP